MAYFKGLDLLLMLPLLAFLITSNLKYAFGVIPVFWTYALYQRGLAGEPTVWIFLGGIFAYTIVLSILLQQFKTRVFNR